MATVPNQSTPTPDKQRETVVIIITPPSRPLTDRDFRQALGRCVRTGARPIFVTQHTNAS